MDNKELGFRLLQVRQEFHWTEKDLAQILSLDEKTVLALELGNGWTEEIKDRVLFFLDEKT